MSNNKDLTFLILTKQSLEKAKIKDGLVNIEELEKLSEQQEYYIDKTIFSDQQKYNQLLQQTRVLRKEFEKIESQLIKKKIEHLFNDVLDLYQQSEETVIEEHSTNIEGANKNLIEEIKSYKQDLKTLLKEI
ncbi:hypothetical protein [Bacillus paranthracis]|uniref:hypothetical protein n=1 Tax=Bacillus paranthracis TaxID=2026186 RepID=UPI000A30261C|nr:hypothetical protein [Bacillus paranthracis]SME52559.1 hypothetical protein BACERE00176_05524 [Bacillus paranthracis]